MRLPVECLHQPGTAEFPLLILKHEFELLNVKLSFPQVTRLCDLTVEGDSVTSVGWSERVSTNETLL